MRRTEPNAHSTVAARMRRALMNAGDVSINATAPSRVIEIRTQLTSTTTDSGCVCINANEPKATHGSPASAAATTAIACTPGHGLLYNST